MSTPCAVVTTSPAKINLGLEILGRRDDGYHEIRTVMATVGLFDTLHISQTSTGVTISGVPEVDPADNIVTRAIHAFAKATDTGCGYDVTITKRIPSPGGMGGASSNAASTLLALNALHGSPLSAEQLHQIASSLGSDAPFFLGSPVAISSGTGTTLEPLTPFRAGVVLVVPRLGLSAKTATLYGALRRSDFTDGSLVDGVAEAIRRTSLPPCAALANAFTRALYELAPDLSDVARAMMDAGAPYAALTGAGPGHYTILPTLDAARALAEAIRPCVPEGTLVEAVSLGEARAEISLLTP